MKEIKNSYGVTKVDIINAEASKGYKELVGRVEIVRGAAIINEPDENGVVNTFAYIFTESGEVYGGNSATVARTVDSIIDLLSDEDGNKYGVTVDARESDNERTFFTLRVVPQ